MNAKLHAELSREFREDHQDALGQKPQRHWKTYDCDNCSRVVPVDFIRDISGSSGEGSFCLVCCSEMTESEMLAEIEDLTSDNQPTEETP